MKDLRSTLTEETCDLEVAELGIDVPEWIEQDITTGTVESINCGGCASGAYMPAVTYYRASATMNEHGDDVLQYLQDYLGELPRPDDGESWSGMAVFFLSCAVELWCSGSEQEIMDALEALEDDDD